jgi:hypothetical protein
MNAKQSRLPFRSSPKALAGRTHEHDAVNRRLAYDVLADVSNPKFAHLVTWAKRVIERLEGKATR